MRRIERLCTARTACLLVLSLASLFLQGCLTIKALEKARQPDSNRVLVGDVAYAGFDAGRKEFVLCVVEHPDGASASAGRYALKLPEGLIAQAEHGGVYSDGRYSITSYARPHDDLAAAKLQHVYVNAAPVEPGCAPFHDTENIPIYRVPENLGVDDVRRFDGETLRKSFASNAPFLIFVPVEFIPKNAQQDALFFAGNDSSYIVIVTGSLSGVPFLGYRKARIILISLLEEKQKQQFRWLWYLAMPVTAILDTATLGAMLLFGKPEVARFFGK